MGNRGQQEQYPGHRRECASGPGRRNCPEKAPPRGQDSSKAQWPQRPECQPGGPSRITPPGQSSPGDSNCLCGCLPPAAKISGGFRDKQDRRPRGRCAGECLTSSSAKKRAGKGRRVASASSLVRALPPGPSQATSVRPLSPASGKMHLGTRTPCADTYRTDKSTRK